MNKEVTTGKNKAGRTLAYGVKPNEALYRIYFKGGGQLPKELDGMWTDVKQIESAITVYLNKDKLCKPDQEKKDYKKSISNAKKRTNTLEKKVA